MVKVLARLLDISAVEEQRIVLLSALDTSPIVCHVLITVMLD